MSYSNAIFFFDFEGGSDTARTALTSCTASNPSGSTTRINKTAHGLVDGAVVDLTLFTAWLNDAWKITVFDADNFDLVGATWQSTADASGTATPRGGSSKTDAWKTFTLGPTAARIQPGDFIRLMGSPDPTSLGVNGSWTDGPRAATMNISSSTNASPIVVTHSFVGSQPLAVGDTVIVNGHTTNANGVWETSAVGGSSGAFTATLIHSDGTNSTNNTVGGASGTIRKVNNLRVWLASAVTANVALTGNVQHKTNWTASANVTSSIATSDFKEGSCCLSLAIAAGFTTGLAAYFPTGTIDLSAYQQLSFVIKQTTGSTQAAGGITLTLCSDAAGAVPVNTFSIPALPGVTATSTWQNITVDLATNLGSAIQSIAFNVVSDLGAQTFLLDNAIACKASSSADSLSKTSLIGKNATGETWAGIQSISGKRVMLDGTMAQRPTTTTVLPQGYSGTTETVTTYKRETIKWTPAAAQTTTVQAIQDSGSDVSPITFSGGWNRTDMTTQTGETWLDGQIGFGNFLVDQTNFVSFDKISVIRVNLGSTGTFGYRRAWTNGHWNNCTQRGFMAAQGGGITWQGFACYNGTDGVWLQSCDNSKAIDVVGNGNGQYGLHLDSSNCEVQSVLARNNGWSGIHLGAGAGTVVKNLVTNGNVQFGVETGGVNFGGGGGPYYLFNAIISEALAFAINSHTQQRYSNTRIVSENHGGAAGYTLISTDGGQIESETSIRHTASGLAWKISVTSVVRTTTYPLDFEIEKIAVGANTLVTVSAWMRRTNTGLTHRLACKGGQISGVSADVTTAMTASGDRTVTSITRVGTTATATFNAHGYSNGYTVQISGATPSQYNGTFVINNVTANTWDYTMVSDPGASASGTITAGQWEQVSISFTPSVAGVVAITTESFGGTTFSGYVDDLDLSQV